MQLTINFDSKIPLYTQIRDAIVSGIATGDLTNGTILPSIRALGNELGVNLHTVNKAYKELQREGFVEIQRGRGVVVHAHGSPNQAVAEDNELNREIVAFLLKDEGISVTEAEDGQQAVECFLKMPEGYYDAVLMDIMMPVMDGYQAARAIRGSGKKDAEMIPIIAITANAFAEDKRKTMEAGMDAHLSKPLNVQELMDTIRKFCAGKQICQ